MMFSFGRHRSPLTIIAFISFLICSVSTDDDVTSDATSTTSPTPPTTTPTTTTTRAPAVIDDVMRSVMLGMPNLVSDGSVSSECDDVDVEVAVDKCIRTFLGDVSLERKWPPGNYPVMAHRNTNITVYCRSTSELTQCLNGGTIRRCAKENPKIEFLVERVESPAKYICTEGRKGFESRSGCLEPYAALEECSDQFLPEITDDVRGRRGAGRPICTKMTLFLACVELRLKAVCNRMDGYVDVVQRAWWQPVMTGLDCVLYKPGICQRPKLEECVDPFLKQDTFYTKNKTGVTVVSKFLHGTYPAAIYNETIMLDYCSHYTDMKYCLYTVRQHCREEGKSLSYTVDQLEKPAKYICEDRFHGFINHKYCLNPNMTAYCANKYELFRAYDTANILALVDGRYDDKKKICSLMKGYLSCQGELIDKQNCTGATGMMDAVQRKWLEPLADKIGCSLYEGMSPAEIAGIALGCLFGLALLFSICGNFAARKPSKKY